MSKTAVLILAAGSSSRMGEAKQLLPYKNTTLLGWAIEQAQASHADEVICVLGANAQRIEASIKNYQLKIIYNPNYKKGLSSSIVKGISELQNKDALLIMLADQPNVTTDYLNKLLENHVRYPLKIIASTYGDSIGVPALFPEKYYPELLKFKGDKGAKKFLKKHSSEVVKIAAVNLADIDTPIDYQKLN